MLANHDQNVLVFILDLLKVCLYVKLESSILQDLLCKFAWLDQLRIRLDRSKVMQIFFSVEFPTHPKPIRIRVLDLLLPVYKGNPKHVFKQLFREIWVPFVPPLYLGFCTQNLSKVAHIAVCVNLLWDLWGAFLYTSLGLSRRRFVQELDDYSVAAIRT